MPRIKKQTTRTAVKKIKEKKQTVLEVKKPEIKKEKKLYICTTGKRKSAVAQVKFSTTGTNSILVNKKDYKKYFPYFVWQGMIESPLLLAGLKNYGLIVKVHGGGLKAQAESIRLGISKALVEIDQENRKILKPKGYLSRDSRIKERKKPGLKRARRAPQWNKR